MKKKPSSQRFFATALLASLLTLLSVVFGTPILRVLRNVYGAVWYWGFGVALSAFLWLMGLQGLAMFLFPLWFTIGLYSEFEERGKSGFWIALFSVLMGSALLILVPYVWAQMIGLDLVGEMAKSFDQSIQKFGQLLPSQKELLPNGELMVKQLPKGMILVQMIALASALIFDRQMASLLGLKFERTASEMKLLDFKLPDFMLWLTMFSFLFSFLKLDNEGISVVAGNIFGAMMVMYLFQGLAILETAFLVYRVGTLMRLLIYFFVVGQLFFLLSAVGIIDFWVDFRGRMKRIKPSGKTHNNEEQV